MADPADDFLQLPKGFDSPDPVDGNPFSEGGVRHGFWEKATREAEEEHCRLNDLFMRTPRPKQLEGRIRWDVALFTAKYDIWARRGVHVILSREQLASWDQWLANYANAILKDFRNVLSAPEAAIQALRDALLARREYWRAEGRGFVRLQEAHQAEQVSSNVEEAGILPEAVADSEASAMESIESESTRPAAPPGVNGMNDDGAHPDSVVLERAQLIQHFKRKGKTQGFKITDEMIAHAANQNWNDRTMITWWKRNDPGCKSVHDKMIRAVIAKDPIFIWNPNIKPKRHPK